MKGAFWITSGVPNSALNQYYQAKRALIAFNTVVDSDGPYLDLAAGLGGAGRTLKPEAVTVANNVFVIGQGGALLKGEEGEGWKWTGNIASNATTDHAGFRVADAQLERGEGAMLRPGARSPARGSAEGAFSQVTFDIDGQSRVGKRDAGCDQVSDAPVVNRPLTSADVGPAWLKR
jgi:poly(beta-D-mannuronate) lyase